MTIKNLGNSQYQPVEYCIYCGATSNLRREHIIPFGLSGTAVLPKSTCKSCAQITGRLEEKLLHGAMWPVRVYCDLKSYKKHRNAPRFYPITVVKGGMNQTIQLPIEEYPILLHFPVFAPPGYLAPDGYTSGIHVGGVVTISYGANPEETMKKLGVTEIRHTTENQPVEFARVIAKIGYAMACAEGQLKHIKGDSYVVPSILGQREDIGRWVGTLTQPLQQHSGLLHRVFIHRDFQNGLLIAEVQLFFDAHTPIYGVVIGALEAGNDA